MNRIILVGLAFCLAASCLAASSAQGQTVQFVIDPTKDVQPISPYIYGVNGELNQSQYSNLNLTLERAGGNRWTAYNWTNNASNAGSDYYYENDDDLSSSTAPGEAVIPMLQNAASLNAAALITVPINGWVAASPTTIQINPFATGYSPATSINPSTGQHNFVPEFPTAADNTSNIPNAVYQDQFISLLKSEFPNGFAANSTQPIFVSLDNEPDLWSSTHAEVQTAPVTYSQLLSDSVAYSTAIKNVAPNALVFGPVSYGWEGYETLQNATDSTADNDAIDPYTGKAYGSFLAYYLAQMHMASTAANERLLDVMDLHWYPEATGINASGVATRITGDDNSPGVVAARLQAPRSLWDPTYVETSWITQDSTGGKGIDLIPTLKSEIAANYSGTKLSISEYNYGGGTDISGGIAEADVLGIFGVQGVFSAAEWPLASQEPFILGAMQMYRNYDGKGSSFGDTSISATNSDTVDTSIYASTSSTNPGKMVLVALNKESTPVTTSIAINNNSYNYTSFAVYQLTSSSTINSAGTNASPAYVNTYPIADLSDFTMPGYSVNTIALLLPAAAGTIFDWNTTAASATDWTAGINWTSNGSPGSPGFGVADVARFGDMATIAAGQTVNLNSNEVIAQLLNQNANAWTLGPGSPSNSTLTLHEITQSSSAGLTITAPVIIDSTNQLAFDGTGTGPVSVAAIISGNTTSGALVKSSPGTLTLSGANTYGGGTTLTAGTLTTTSTGTLGSSSGPLAINSTLGAAVVLNLGNNQTVGALSSAVSGAGSTATLNIGSATTLTVNQSTSTAFQGKIVDSGSLATSGVGILQINGAPTLNSGSKLTVNGGTLEFNVSSGTASVGTGVVATVASGATLQLAGSTPALSNGSVINPSGGDLVAISNSGSVSVTGTNQSAGAITGSGSVVVQSGANLTATQIIQSTLTIGAGSAVTIQPSGSGISNGVAASIASTADAAATSTQPSTPAVATGDPFIAILAALTSSYRKGGGNLSSQNVADILGSLSAAEAELNVGATSAALKLERDRVWSIDDESPTSESALRLRIDVDELLWSDEQPANSALAFSDTAGSAPPTSVPEPSTLLLSAIGLLGLGFARRNRRSRS